MLASAAPVQAYSFKRSSEGAAVHWADSEPVELKLGTGMEGYLGPGQAYAAAVIAAEAWRGYAGVPEIVVTDGPVDDYDPNVRHNGIYVLNPWPFEAERLAVTITAYQVTGELVGVDVLVNGEVDYRVLPEANVPESMAASHDLPAVLTHEFGHVLGLDESMDDPEATMWPYIRPGETHQRTLADDDESAVSSLYETPFHLPGLACGQNSVLGAGRGDSTPATLLALGLLALVVRRRRR